jgi:hypothetical protein
LILWDIWRYYDGLCAAILMMSNRNQDYLI